MRSFICPLSFRALDTFSRPFACCFYSEISMPSSTLVKECAEVKTTGGVAYDVILSEPKTETVLKRPVSPPKKSEKSLTDIASKLAAAEERRKSMESQLLQRLAEERALAQEKASRVMKDNNNFQEVTKKQLDEKMQVFEENRNARFQALQKRLKEKEIHGREVRNHKRSISQENAENGN
ncbi:stathmin-like isoform X1 [Saccoglossus kowalevskii]|uniref:Stathmin n=1 Tax=Saccoglossus kowalevskii TaxID=10224 RepID=A0A0U2T2W0_SACKO|nr:PREDICTED: stathmin-like isoform X1 [Saccoglossus kowalevskii]ALR88693.1 stathmin 1-like 119 [Saccoglossus kowalevskii]